MSHPQRRIQSLSPVYFNCSAACMHMWQTSAGVTRLMIWLKSTCDMVTGGEAERQIIQKLVQVHPDVLHIFPAYQRRLRPVGMQWRQPEIAVGSQEGGCFGYPTHCSCISPSCSKFSIPAFDKACSAVQFCGHICMNLLAGIQHRIL